MFKKCRACKFRCTCCRSRSVGLCCSGCDNSYDEFEPAVNIIFCPLDGTPITAEQGTPDVDEKE